METVHMGDTQARSDAQSLSEDGSSTTLRDDSDSLSSKDEKEMASDYTYQPLDPSLLEIRVLRRASSATRKRWRWRTSPCYTFQSVRLTDSDATPFVAVSYCWGKKPGRARITLDDTSVTIPGSAARALEALQGNANELIWVDAVCIDQGNLQEKSEQVNMMKTVYSRASEVRIWLGNDPRGNMSAAIPSIEKIYAQCLEFTDGLARLQERLYGTDGSAGFKYSDEALPGDCDWVAVRAFYSAAWFERLWVIQEIGLARRAKCYVGSAVIDAEKVVLAARWMVHRKYAKHFDGQELPGVESASSMYKPANRPFFNQLRRTHRAQCSKPQDKVYGLLGLLRTEIADRIQADYSKPLVEVYAEATRLALVEAGDLSFLQFVAWFRPSRPKPRSWKGLLSGISACNCFSVHDDTSRSEEWPSWVLRFHGETTDESGSCRNIQNFNKTEWKRHFARQALLTEDSLSLRLCGERIDRITQVGPLFTTQLLKDFSALRRALQSCVELQAQGGVFIDRQRKSASEQDLALCLCCGIDRFNQDAANDETVRNGLADLLAFCNSIRSEKRRRSRHGGYSSLPDNLPAYWHYLWSNAMNRHLFRTSSGMLGMGPPDTRDGDVVTILFGCEVPFLLRPVNEHDWRLVGDCYVREVMDGDQYNSSSMGTARWFNII